ncbi:MAG TPA: hypothetical protein VME86_00780 [Acidobacteriaceae bacterium]|nr:hypothetical protein [Acidobacteriaceae bacterium]
MPLPPSVLLLGPDVHLIEDRRRLLESCGYEVFMASHFPTLIETLRAQQVDLLMMCHSLSDEDCDRAVTLVKGARPKVEVLVLVAARADSGDGNESGEIDTEAGLKSLMAALGGFLKSHMKPVSNGARRREGHAEHVRRM